MLRLALIFAMLAAPASALTIRFPEGNGEWVEVSDETGRIRIVDSRGLNVSLPDQFGRVSNGVRTIRAHGGGYVYKAMFMAKRDSDRRVRLLCDGFDPLSMMPGCTSSATLWLGAANVCIGRRAVFNFHGASVDMLGKTPDLDATESMARFYPPKIAKVFRAKWSKRRGMAVYTVTASELLAIMPELEVCK